MLVHTLSDIPTLFTKYGVAKSILDKISIWEGDITKLECDAIVNAANRGLRGGGGVDGAIHSAAGHSDLQKECRAIGRCETGDAVITTGCKISHIKNIIHTVGPQLSFDEPSVNDEEKLLSCYDRCLELAVQHDLKSITFCCISTGVYGYPHEKAAFSVGRFLIKWLEEHPSSTKIERVVLCIFNPLDGKAYEEFFDQFAANMKEKGDSL